MAQETIDGGVGDASPPRRLYEGKPLVVNGCVNNLMQLLLVTFALLSQREKVVSWQQCKPQPPVSPRAEGEEISTEDFSRMPPGERMFIEMLTALRKSFLG